jgi:hypothetical protein
MTDEIFGQNKKPFIEEVAELAALTFEGQIAKPLRPYVDVAPNNQQVLEEMIDTVSKKLEENRRELAVIRERLSFAWTQSECSADAIVQLKKTLKLL